MTDLVVLKLDPLITKFSNIKPIDIFFAKSEGSRAHILTSGAPNGSGLGFKILNLNSLSSV